MRVGARVREERRCLQRWLPAAAAAAAAQPAARRHVRTVASAVASAVAPAVASSPAASSTSTSATAATAALAAAVPAAVPAAGPHSVGRRRASGVAAEGSRGARLGRPKHLAQRCHRGVVRRQTREPQPPRGALQVECAEVALSQRARVEIVPCHAGRDCRLRVQQLHQAHGRLRRLPAAEQVPAEAQPGEAQPLKVRVAQPLAAQRRARSRRRHRGRLLERGLRQPQAVEWAA